jgi:uncharacterized protein YoxC
MATDVEIKDIIAETIHELHADGSPILFKKPTTVQGWFYIVAAICSCIAFLWTSAVFLNKVAHHSEEPYHVGTLDLIKEIQIQNQNHATSEELHKREAELELHILSKVDPIKEDLVSIKENQISFKHDVRDIKQDVRDVQQSINNLAEQINKK